MMWLHLHAKQAAVAVALLAVAAALCAFGVRVLAVLLERFPADAGLDGPQAPALSRRTVVILLGVFIVLGGAFRFAQLDRQVYWNDEVWTGIRVAGLPKTQLDKLFDGRVLTAQQFRTYIHGRASPPEIAGALATSEPQWPPLFYFLEWAWTGLFGTSIVALRALAALLGVACIPAIYATSFAFFRSRFAALAAAALLALSPAQIVYAREARSYSLILLLAMLSTTALLFAMRRRGRAWWFVFGALSVLGIYTYTLYAMVIVGQVLLVVVTERSLRAASVRAAATAGAIALLSFVPWATFIIKYRWVVSNDLSATAQHYSLPFYVARVFLEIAMTFSAGSYFLLRLAPVDIVAGLVAIFFAVLFARHATRATIALVCIALPCVAFTLLADAARHEHLILLYRYQPATWLVLVLAVSGGIAWVFGHARRSWRFAGSGFACVLLCASAGTSAIAIASPTFWDSWFDAPSPVFAQMVNALRDPLVIVDSETQDIFTFVGDLRPDIRIAFVPRRHRTMPRSLAGTVSDVVIPTPGRNLPSEWRGAPLALAYTFDMQPSLVMRLRRRFHNHALAYGHDPFTGTTTFWIASKTTSGSVSKPGRAK